VSTAGRLALQLAGVQPQDNSLGVRLLASIQSMFERQQTERLSSEMIIHALAESEDSPWPERLPLTKVHLARLLAPFGIRPTIVYRRRAQVSRGYLSRDFAENSVRAAGRQMAVPAGSSPLAVIPIGDQRYGRRDLPIGSLNREKSALQ